MNKTNRMPFPPIRPGNESGRTNFPPKNHSKFKKGRKNKHSYINHFQCYKPPYGYQPHWNFYQWRRPPSRKRLPMPEKPPSRPPSPFSGTEEYTLKKIQEASDMIKKQLMMPADAVGETVEAPVLVEKIDEIVDETRNEKCENGKSAGKSKKPVYNVEEIQQKIITHITNLKHGKKVNLICGPSSSSGYDEAIQQIQKQKRLELSRVLRDMCSNQTVENSDVFNSIIPDMGIKIEDLPLDVIQEIRTTLDLNFDDASLEESDEIVKIKTETCDSNESIISSYPNSVNIKVENDFNEFSEFCNEFGDFKDSDMECQEPETPIVSQESEREIRSVTTNPGSCQTDSVSLVSEFTQTDLDLSCSQFKLKSKPLNLEEAVESMFEIDKEIMRLTKLRQSIFTFLQKKSEINKIKETETDTEKTTTTQTTISPESDNNMVYKETLVFDIAEKILVIKELNNTLVAGSESGKLFYFSLEDGTLTKTIEIGQFPITSLCVWTSKKKNLHLFVGSFETTIKGYNFENGNLFRSAQIGDGVQCMELSWDCIFIGTMNGSLIRYSLTKWKIEFEDKISDDRILVLKAAQEGARPILLVATKNRPVCIRDAMSGLHMRTLNHVVAPTVYTLLLENSLVYCGTPFHDILVFSFHDGNLVRKYQASNAKGISCMKIVDKLLYACCHNGSIYVYNVVTRQYVGRIGGPGGVILSMEVFKNIIIVGTMSFNFQSILIPEYILENNKYSFN